MYHFLQSQKKKTSENPRRKRQNLKRLQPQEPGQECEKVTPKKRVEGSLVVQPEYSPSCPPAPVRADCTQSRSSLSGAMCEREEPRNSRGSATLRHDESNEGSESHGFSWGSWIWVDRLKFPFFFPFFGSLTERSEPWIIGIIKIIGIIWIYWRKRKRASGCFGVGGEPSLPPVLYYNFQIGPVLPFFNWEVFFYFFLVFFLSFFLFFGFVIFAI